MPVTVRKNRSGGYVVRTPSGVKAKNASKEDAMAQERLLRGVEHGWKPTGSEMVAGMKKRLKRKE